MPARMTEYDRPSAELFQRDLYWKAQPVVLRGIAADWEPVAAGLGSPQQLADWLKDKVGSRSVDILSVKSPEDTMFFYGDDLTEMNFDRGSLPFDAFVDAVLSGADQDQARNLYLQGTLASTLSSQLQSALRLPHVPPSAEPSVWMGNRTVAQTHFDLAQNIAVVVSGRRTFTLFPPEQIANLYMGPMEQVPYGTPVSMVRLDNPDFAKHPNFRIALDHALVADLGPGDGIFIPYMWWHRVEASGSLNMLVNYWWNEYGEFGSPMFSMLHAILTMRDMAPAMRSAWRAMFDHFVFGAGQRAMDHVPPASRGGLGPIDPQMRADLWRSIAAGIHPHVAETQDERT